jgi:hypothetical protein
VVRVHKLGLLARLGDDQLDIELAEDAPLGSRDEAAAKVSRSRHLDGRDAGDPRSTSSTVSTTRTSWPAAPPRPSFPHREGSGTRDTCSQRSPAPSRLPTLRAPTAADLVGLGLPCHPEAVVTPRSDVARIASGNLRVPRDEFLAIWDEARRREAAVPEHDVTDWYVAAVGQTCRWMAAAPMRTALCGGLPRSPVTRRACLARAESIEAEWQAAQALDQFSADFASRPGWCDGVRATFRWAWCRQGPPPLEVRLI